jgi:hypothetical protein
MKKIILAAPLALAAASLLSSPASAQSWNHANPGSLRAEISQLDRQIDRSRGLSNREERALSRRVGRLQYLYGAYARHGFNRGEVQSLRREIASVRFAIERQAHDWNNHPGRSGRHDYR